MLKSFVVFALICVFVNGLQESLTFKQTLLKNEIIKESKLRAAGGSGGALGDDSCSGCKHEAICYYEEDANCGGGSYGDTYCEDYEGRVRCQDKDGDDQVTIWSSNNRDNRFHSATDSCSCNKAYWVFNDYDDSTEQGYSIYESEIDGDNLNKDFAGHTDRVLNDLVADCSCKKAIWADSDYQTDRDNAPWSIYTRKMGADDDDDEAEIINDNNSDFMFMFPSCKCKRIMYGTMSDTDVDFRTAKYDGSDEKKIISYDGSDVSLEDADLCESKCEFVWAQTDSSGNKPITTVEITKLDGSGDTRELARISGQTYQGGSLMCKCNRFVLATQDPDDGSFKIEMGPLNDENPTTVDSDSRHPLYNIDASCECGRVYWVKQTSDEGAWEFLSDNFSGNDLVTHESGSDTEQAPTLYINNCACNQIYWMVDTTDGEDHFIKHSDKNGEAETLTKVSNNKVISTFIQSCVCGYVYWVETDTDDSNSFVLKRAKDESNPSEEDVFSTSDVFGGYLAIGCGCKFAFFTTVDSEGDTILRMVKLSDGVDKVIKRFGDDVAFNTLYIDEKGNTLWIDYTDTSDGDVNRIITQYAIVDDDTEEEFDIVNLEPEFSEQVEFYPTVKGKSSSASTLALSCFALIGAVLAIAF